MILTNNNNNNNISYMVNKNDSHVRGLNNFVVRFMLLCRRGTLNN